MIKIHHPKKPSFPLIVSVPHAGTEIPDALRKSFATQDPALLKLDADLYVDELYESVPVYGGTLMVTPICRYVIDPNRDASIVDASFVTGAPVVAQPKHLGLVAHKTTQGHQLLKTPLSQKELQERIKLYYQPFHDTLAKLIQDTKEQFGFCIHIDAHSMPSKGTRSHDDEGGIRADIVPGDRNSTSCSPTLTDFIDKHFQAAGCSVARNSPYPGGYITEHYGNPSQNTHSIQIEINRRLYMNEQNYGKNTEDFENLRTIIENLIYKVREWRPH